MYDGRLVHFLVYSLYSIACLLYALDNVNLARREMPTQNSPHTQLNISLIQKYLLALACQLPPAMEFIRKRCLSEFGHIALPMKLQHTMPYIVKSAWHLVVHLVGTRDVIWLSSCLLDRPLRPTTQFVPTKLWRKDVLVE